MKVKVIARDSIIIISICIGLLITAEIVLRVIYPDKIASPGPVAFEFNKDYLVSLKPNIENRYSRSPANGGDIITWRTNKYSFRGKELQPAPSMRIIVYGDSNVQARFSILENTFPYKLEAYLAQSGIRNIEVLNAGIIGFGPDQSLIRFMTEADTYKPDLVIFHIVAENDFGDIIRNRLFELDANGNLTETRHPKTIDQLLVDPIEQSTNSFISSFLLMQAANKIVGIQKKDDKRKYWLNFSLDKLQRDINEEYAIYKEGRPRHFSHFADHYDLDVASFPDAESSTIKKQLMVAILRKAQMEARAKGIQFLVTITPSASDLTKNSTELNYEILQTHFPQYRKVNLTNVLKNICMENNIQFISLFDTFEKSQPETLFFRKDDTHWNDHGQDLAAREAAAYISKYMLASISN